MPKNYELALILDSRLPEETIAEGIARVESVILAHSGIIHKIDRWGKRRLAYELKKQREGYYAFLYFECDDEKLLSEIEHHSRITDTILRYMIVRRNAAPEIQESAPPREQIPESAQEESAEPVSESPEPSDDSAQDDENESVEMSISEEDQTPKIKESDSKEE